MTKSQILAQEYGFDDVNEFMLDVGLDSSVPAICTNKDCNYTTEMEPDQDRGWCEGCNRNTVKSILILEGLI